MPDGSSQTIEVRIVPNVNVAEWATAAQRIQGSLGMTGGGGAGGKSSAPRGSGSVPLVLGREARVVSSMMKVGVADGLKLGGMIGGLLALGEIIKIAFGMVFKMLGAIFKVLGMTLMPIANMLLGPLMILLTSLLTPILKFMWMVWRPHYKAMMEQIKAQKDKGVKGLPLMAAASIIAAKEMFGAIWDTLIAALSAFFTMDLGNQLGVIILGALFFNVMGVQTAIGGLMGSIASAIGSAANNLVIQPILSAANSIVSGIASSLRAFTAPAIDAITVAAAGIITSMKIALGNVAIALAPFLTELAVLVGVFILAGAVVMGITSMLQKLLGFFVMPEQNAPGGTEFGKLPGYPSIGDYTTTAVPTGTFDVEAFNAAKKQFGDMSGELSTMVPSMGTLNTNMSLVNPATFTFQNLLTSQVNPQTSILGGRLFTANQSIANLSAAADNAAKKLNDVNVNIHVNID